MHPLTVSYRRHISTPIHKIIICICACTLIYQTCISQVTPPFNDLDNDGVEDYIDLDSDNDGISDNLESVVCEIVDINSLNGSMNALEAFNNANITVGGINGSLIQIETPLTFVGGAEIDEFIVSDDHTGNEVGMLLGVFSDSPSQYLGTNYNFSSPVYEFNFKIFDLDRTDAITVNGYYQGELQTFMIEDQGDCVNFNGNNEFISVCNVQAGLDPIELQDHSFILTFDGFIDRLEFTYYDQGPGRGGSFTFVPTPEPTCLGLDHDLDGVPDFLDLDSDNDGIPDAIEACGDTSVVLDGCTLDFDNSEEYILNNGLSTGLLANTCSTEPIDTDNDGIADYLDLDSDGDNCPDSIEECVPFSLANDSPQSNGYNIPAADVNDFGLLQNGQNSCFIPSSTDWLDANVVCLKPTLNLLIPAECFEENGVAEINIEGGELPYSIVWDNGETNSLNSNLAPGIASVTVTDGCNQVMVSELNIPEESCTVGLSLLKRADISQLSSPATPGDIINYSFVVCNTGTGKLRSVEILDVLFPVQHVIDTLLGETCDSTNFVGQYAISQTDIDQGEILNVATVSAIQPSGENLSSIDQNLIALDQSASIDIMKIANPQDENGNGIFEVNETIEYSFLIHNTGNVTLSNVIVIDEFVNVNGAPIPTMAPGDMNSNQYSASYTIRQSDVNQGFVFNEATVIGQDPDNDNVTDIDDANISLIQDPEVMFLKESIFIDENQDGLSQSGESVQYIFTVINSGNVTLSNFVVSDPLITVTGSLDFLDPGEISTQDFSGTYIITQDDVDAGMITNSAIIQAEDPEGNTVSDISDDPSNPDNIDINGDGDFDDSTITLLLQGPQITILKSGTFQDENGDGLAQVDETISYSFSIRNTGNTTLTDILVNDPLVSVSGGNISLAPNEQNQSSISAVYSITQQDIDKGFVENSAVVSARSPLNETISDISDDPLDATDIDSENDGEADDSTIVSLPQLAEINTLLIGRYNDENSDNLGQPYESISFTLTIENTGNVSLSNFTVEIDSVDIINFSELSLSPGESNNSTYTITYTVSQSDIDLSYVTRFGTIKGQSPSGLVAQDITDDPSTVLDQNIELNVNPSDLTIVPINQLAQIELSKLGKLTNQSVVSSIGSSVDYNFIIRNTGNVTLTDIQLMDPLIDINGSIIPVMSPGGIDDSNFTGEYILIQSDIDQGFIFNEASVRALDPFSKIVSSTDNISIDISQRANVSLSKTGIWNDENEDGISQVGESISYIFTIENTGNVTINDIVIDDPIITVENADISLLPGMSDSISYTGTYSITQQDIDMGFISNSAIVSVADPEGMIVTDQSDDPNNSANNDPDGDGEPDDVTLTYIAQSASIYLEKNGQFIDDNDDGLAQVGESIQYSFSIENNGNVTLYNVHIIDSLIQLSGSNITLQNGEVNSDHFVGTYTLTQNDIDRGFVDNQAEVFALTTQQESVSDLSSDRVMLSQDANINLLLSADFKDENGDGLGQPNETVEYQLEIINTGNVTLSNVNLVYEDIEFQVNELVDIVPGIDHSIILNGRYALIQSDIDTGEIIRQIYISAESELGEVVSNFSDDPFNSADIDINGDNNPDDPTVVSIGQYAQIDFLKSGEFLDESSDGYGQPGESILYKFQMTNLGNVTLSNVSIEDINFDDLIVTDLTLQPSETVEIERAYSLTQFDIDAGFVSNTAIAAGQDPNGDVISEDSDDPINDTDQDQDMDGDPDDVTTTIIPQKSSLNVEMLGYLKDTNGDGFADIGEKIDYQFAVRNSGNVTLKNITLSQENISINGDIIDILGPQDIDTTSFNAEYFLELVDVKNLWYSSQVKAEAFNSVNEVLYDFSDDPLNISDQDFENDNEPDDPTVVNYCGIQMNNLSVNPAECFSGSSHCLNVKQTSEAIVPFGFQYVYVLTVGDDYTIEQISFSPEIRISKTGTYHVHPLIAQINQAGGEHYFDLSFLEFGQSNIHQLIQELETQMVCADLDPIGIKSDIYNCRLDLVKEQTETTVLNGSEAILSFDITITNIGEFPVANFALEDQLSFFPIALPANNLNANNVELRISDINALALPTLNSQYNGITDLQLLTGTDGYLAPNQGFIINLKTKVDTEKYKDLDGPQVNTAEVTADVINKLGQAFDIVKETSDDPQNPLDQDPDNDGDPDDPTKISLPICQDLVCNSNVNISLNENCLANLSPELFLKGPANFNNYQYEFFDAHNESLGDVISTEAVIVKVTHLEGCIGGGCWSRLTVETNSLPVFESDCSCENPDQNLIRNCQTNCIANELPQGIITEEMIIATFADCAPELIDLNIIEERQGAICDPNGEEITIQYIAKIRRHERIETVNLLCQSYSIKSLEFNDDQENLTYLFDFPKDLQLNCDYDSLELSAEETSIFDPQYLSRIANSKYSFPFFIDLTTTINDTTFIYNTEQVEDEQNAIQKDTIIQQDIDGDNILEWVKTTIIVKPLKDTIIIDTMINTAAHPVVPIQSDGICNILSSYSDASFSSCGQGQKLARSWTIINWCDANVAVSGIQTIDIIDTSDPVVLNQEELSHLKYIETDPWSCSAIFKLPTLDLIDNCDSDLDIDWSASTGRVDGDYIVDIYPHDQKIQLTAIIIDDCENATSVTTDIVVVDKTPPVVVCHSSLQVSLTYGEGSVNGVATILATDFDEGSHDACGKIEIQVIRQDDYTQEVRDCSGQLVGFKPQSCFAQSEIVKKRGVYSDKNCDEEVEYEISTLSSSVSFCCEDLGQLIPVIVIITDKNGQSNQCFTTVFVDNLIQAEMICEDANISCVDGQVLEDPIIVNQICSSESNLSPILLSEIRDDRACQNGSVIQEWYLDIDRSDSFTEGDKYCSRSISVEAENAFDPLSIKWPVHRTGITVDAKNIECHPDEGIQQSKSQLELPHAYQCVPEQNYETPTWCIADCGLVGFSVSVDTIHTAGACFDIVYRWSVIDWCVFDSNNDNVALDDSDKLIAVEDWAIGECTTCPSYFDTSSSIYYAYEEVDVDGFYHYDQVVSIRDESAPVVEVLEELMVNINCDYAKDDACCTGFEILTVRATDYCNDEVVGEQLKWKIDILRGVDVLQTLEDVGVEISFRTLDSFNGDVHTIRWTVRDGCGNVSIDSTHVRYIDIQAPSPVCLSSLTVGVDSSGTIWGNELDFGSFDNCTSTEDLQFSIVQAGESPLAPSDPYFEDQLKFDFSCNSPDLIELDIWIWDADYNGNKCQSVLLIQSDCNYENASFASISGQIQTSYGDMVSDAMIRLNSKDKSLEDMTAINGSYQFPNLEMGNSFTSFVEKNGSFVNGLSTKDLIIIRQYILGKYQFDNSYQMIAADASNSNSVSAADLVLLKNLILGNTKTLPSNTVWKFIPSNFSFFDTENPWPFIEEMTYQSLDDDMTNQDYIAVKIGDVTGDAIANDNMKSESRSSDKVDFLVANKSVRKGDIVNIPVSCINCNDMKGHQFTMEHEGLEFIDLTSAKIEIDRDDVGVFENNFTLSSYKTAEVNISPQDVLYSLQFKALKNLELKNVLRLSSEITTTESYIGTSLNTTLLSLSFLEPNDHQSKQFIVDQNKPNPFLLSTQIEFNIPQNGTVQFKVFSLDGIQLISKSRNYNSGENIISLQRNDLPAAGIYMYQLTYKNDIKLGKMSAMKSF